jgi:cyclopropane-fatty-acyl-phospholipid synthase
MLFKFKSKATGDLIMLEPNGRRVLQLIGKEPGPSGIIQPGQMTDAVAALEKAIAEEEAAQKAAEDEARAKGEQPRAKPEVVSLRQRAVPFIEMLRRAQAAGKDVVWGV